MRRARREGDVDHARLGLGVVAAGLAGVGEAGAERLPPLARVLLVGVEEEADVGVGPLADTMMLFSVLPLKLTRPSEGLVQWMPSLLVAYSQPAAQLGPPCVPHLVLDGTMPGKRRA